MLARQTCHDFVRLQAYRDDNARADVGTAPPLTATPKLLPDREVRALLACHKDTPFVHVESNANVM